MGIEIIVIVLGFAVVIALAANFRKSKNKIGRSRVPETKSGSTYPPKRE